jgi:4-diphosphocytidyl-2-C-methyl-D-erythritol kinase
MPELPEVEVTKIELVPHIVGNTIKKIIIRDHRLRWPINYHALKKLENKKVISLSRRGKYIFINSEAGTAMIHLGMSGSLSVLDRNAIPEKHDHFDIQLENQKIVRFNDPRRFGCFEWAGKNPENHKLISHLGLEPLEKEFTGDYLYQVSRNRTTAVKALIMNASIVVGVGNIYANESLFISGIHPKRMAKNISKNNTITKLLVVLDEKNLLNNNKFQIKIIKNIPQKSGMGGGSMNAASLLDYFFKKKLIKISIKEIYKIAYSIGSDVALGLQKKNTILFANKSIKKLDLKTKIHVLLVKPNIHYSTKFIYSKVKEYSKKQYKHNYKTYFTKNYLINSKNDLEKIVLSKHPKIKSLKNFLKTLPGLTFVRMTGSGSTIVAYFKSKKALDIATRIFEKQYSSYWSIKSKTI